MSRPPSVCTKPACTDFGEPNVCPHREEKCKMQHVASIRRHFLKVPSIAQHLGKKRKCSVSFVARPTTISQLVQVMCK